MIEIMVFRTIYYDGCRHTAASIDRGRYKHPIALVVAHRRNRRAGRSG